MRGTDDAATAAALATAQTAINAIPITAMRGTDSAALASTLAGITSLAAWLRALARSDAADATAKTEINTGGGDWDEATDSEEALAGAGAGGAPTVEQIVEGIQVVANDFKATNIDTIESVDATDALATAIATALAAYRVSSAGPGETKYTVKWRDADLNGIADARSWIVNSDGATVHDGTTNSDGEVTYWLSSGVTYTVYFEKDGYDSDSEEFTVP